MNDSNVTITDLKQKIEAIIKEREWEQFHTPKNMSMAIAVEASELMELFVYATAEESKEIVVKKRQQFQHELADVMITCLSLANRTNTDMATIVTEKLEEIKKKYPVETSKGKWTKYTDHR